MKGYDAWFGFLHKAFQIPLSSWAEKVKWALPISWASLRSGTAHTQVHIHGTASQSFIFFWVPILSPWYVRITVHPPLSPELHVFQNCLFLFHVSSMATSNFWVQEGSTQVSRQAKSMKTLTVAGCEKFAWNLWSVEQSPFLRHEDTGPAKVGLATVQHVPGRVQNSKCNVLMACRQTEKSEFHLFKHHEWDR